jgi:hypothetical protein
LASCARSSQSLRWPATLRHSIGHAVH